MISQTDNYTPVAIEQAQTAAEVKGMVASTVPSHMQVYYINFANGLRKLLRTYAGATLCNEVDVLFDKNEARGLDDTLLRSIIGYYAASCMPPVLVPFRLDISLLDGPDVLV